MLSGRLVKFYRYMFVLLLFGGTFAFGQTGSDWRELRTQLWEEINLRVQSEAQEAVRPESVAMAHSFPWPVTAPTVTLDEVYSKFDKNLQEELAQEFPSRLVIEINQEALRRHGYWKIGDEVTLQTRGKMSHAITGRLQAVTLARVKIANRWLSALDLDDETMARFFPEQAEQAQKRYVERETRRLNLRRQSFIEQFCQQRLPILLRQAGYLPLQEGNDPETLNPANWLSRADFFAQRLYAARVEKARELQWEVEREVFSANNFYYDTETKQWLPEVESKSSRGRQRAARRETDGEESTLSKLKRLFK